MRTGTTVFADHAQSKFVFHYTEFAEVYETTDELGHSLLGCYWRKFEYDRQSFEKKVKIEFARGAFKIFISAANGAVAGLLAGPAGVVVGIGLGALGGVSSIAGAALIDKIVVKNISEQICFSNFLKYLRTHPVSKETEVVQWTGFQNEFYTQIYTEKIPSYIKKRPLNVDKLLKAISLDTPTHFQINARAFSFPDLSKLGDVNVMRDLDVFLRCVASTPLLEFIFLVVRLNIQVTEFMKLGATGSPLGEIYKNLLFTIRFYLLLKCSFMERFFSQFVPQLKNISSGNKARIFEAKSCARKGSFFVPTDLG